MKKLIFIIAINFFCFTLKINAQIIWENTIGGTGEENCDDIQPTNDGGYIMCGPSNSDISGDKTENSMGDTDFWVIKLDSSGNIQWQNTIGGNTYDQAYSIAQTSDGGYIVGGISKSMISGDKTEDCLGTWDYWVFKLDNSGNIQWQNTIGGNDEDILRVIRQTADGGYIIGGDSKSGISGDKTENFIGSFSETDYWIVKLDINGVIQWQNTIGGDSREYLRDLNQTADHGYILGGSSISNISGDKTENMIGDYDMWMVKVDSAGNVQWENTIGGDEVDGIQSLEQTSDGGYIIGGGSKSGISGDKTEPLYGPFGTSDYWIVKTDAAGNIQWQNTIGGTSWDDFYSIQQTISGDYIAIGKSYSDTGVDKTEMCLGVWDYWIVKTDPSGNIIWQKTIGGSGWDEAPVMREVADGNYIIGGTSYSNRSGDKSEDCMGPFDCWVLKITDKFNTITGKLFVDLNSNTSQDAGESSVGNRKITEVNTGIMSFSKPDGTYSLVVLDSGNYTVESAISYYNPVPFSHDVYFSGISQFDSLNDFAFQPAGVFNDLCITITPLSRFRPSTIATYMISYENAGTTTLSPTVIFFPDSNLTFVSSNPLANAVTTDSLVWNFGPMVPYQTGNILVSLLVNPAATQSTIIYSHVRIEPVAGDANTACNYNEMESNVTLPYDPNVILVNRDTVLTTELSNPPYLDYIIFFQNTGNDTAFNVRVLNNLPLESDVNSFEFIASSDPVNITYGAHSQLMTFAFDNIQLPDSNINEPESHGFVRYRIKPKTTLAAGDHIPNTAFIYFDFNAPVQTNTAITEIVLPTGINQPVSANDHFIKLYPNPAKETLVIVSPLLSNEKTDLKIADLTGRIIFSQDFQTGNHRGSTSIDISGFSQGVYIVRLESVGRISIGKFAIR